MKKPIVIVYVVGEVISYTDKSWSIIGVFNTEKEALKHCKTEDYFIGPIQIGKAFHKKSEWKGAWYPKLESKPSYDVSRPKSK
jgi:hypothetical protein